MIKSERGRLSVKRACALLEVSASGYYSWFRKPAVVKPDVAGILVLRVFYQNHCVYGVRRIRRALWRSDYFFSEATIRNRMKRYGLIAKASKKYKATTNSKHNLPVSPNLLNQDFVAHKINQAWVTDFTYIWTGDGWSYLAVVVDLYSRKVVGWHIAARMTKELVSSALKMAVRNRKPPADLIIHSDRGSQYCSREYQSLLETYKMISSMSKKGDCYDNACAESFFHSLKVEWLHGVSISSRAECFSKVQHYIEVFFNNQRLHSYLNYSTPSAFEAAA
jgi:transposase InsO family protein